MSAGDLANELLVGITQERLSKVNNMESCIVKALRRVTLMFHITAFFFFLLLPFLFHSRKCSLHEKSSPLLLPPRTQSDKTRSNINNLPPFVRWQSKVIDQGNKVLKGAKSTIILFELRGLSLCCAPARKPQKLQIAGAQTQRRSR